MTGDVEPAARRPTPWRVVMFGFLGLVGVALAAMLWGWYSTVRYDPVAARHLPAATTLAVRLDTQQRLVHEPVSRHLFPLADAVRRKLSAAELPGDRLKRVRERTGLNLPRDLREVIYAEARIREHWLVLLGGRFPTSGVVAGIGAVLVEEGSR